MRDGHGDHDAVQAQFTGVANRDLLDRSRICRESTFMQKQDHFHSPSFLDAMWGMSSSMPDKVLMRKEIFTTKKRAGRESALLFCDPKINGCRTQRSELR